MSEWTGSAVEQKDSGLARAKACAWKQEDLAITQGRTGPMSGVNAFDRTRGWCHARGGQLSPPALHEQKQWTFEVMAPERLSPGEMMPEPVDQGALRFAIRRLQDGKQRQATMMWTRGEAGFDEAALGQEVDRLYRWMQMQRATVGPIAELAPVMGTLQRNGILDDDLRVADEADLGALLQDVARSGRADAYPTDGPALSAGVLKASQKVAECDADLMARLAEAQLLGDEIKSLGAQIRAVRFEVKALYERRAQRVAERDAASLMREKAETLAWIDAFAGAVGGWSMALKGAVGPGGLGGKADMGAGGFGALSAVGKLVVNQIYERRIAEAFDRVRTLRRRAEEFENARLAAKLDALAARMSGYVTKASRLREAIEAYRVSRSRAFAVLGSTMAESLPRMGPDTAARQDTAFNAGKPHAAGRIQRLFANVPVYEEAVALADRVEWPELQGHIPMSGFLFWSDESGVLTDIGEEAAKLRWWRERADGVRGLLERIRASIDGTGELAQSIP